MLTNNFLSLAERAGVLVAIEGDEGLGGRTFLKDIVTKARQSAASAGRPAHRDDAVQHAFGLTLTEALDEDTRDWMPVEACLQAVGQDSNATMYERTTANIYLNLHTLTWGYYQLAEKSKLTLPSSAKFVAVQVSYAADSDGTVALQLSWYDGDYDCNDNMPCYLDQTRDLGTLTGEAKTVSVKRDGMLFVYKSDILIKRVVIVEEGQAIKLSYADVRSFSVGDRVKAQWKSKRQLFPATVRAVHAADNSYDLAYDDGDSETGVAARLVQPLPAAAAMPPAPAPRVTASATSLPDERPERSGGEL